MRKEKHLIQNKNLRNNHNYITNIKNKNNILNIGLKKIFLFGYLNIETKNDKKNIENKNFYAYFKPINIFELLILLIVGYMFIGIFVIIFLIIVFAMTSFICSYLGINIEKLLNDIFWFSHIVFFILYSFYFVFKGFKHKDYLKDYLVIYENIRYNKIMIIKK